MMIKIVYFKIMMMIHINYNTIDGMIFVLCTGESAKIYKGIAFFLS